MPRNDIYLMYSFVMTKSTEKQKKSFRFDNKIISMDFLSSKKDLLPQRIEKMQITYFI